MIGIIGVSIAAVLINIVVYFDTKNLIGLFALLCFLILLMFYNIKFIDLYLDKNRFFLKKFDKEIEYNEIIKIKKLPIFKSQLGTLSTIFLIKFSDKNQKIRLRLFEIKQKKFLQIPDLERALSVYNVKN
jgi:hypothetical protein